MAYTSSMKKSASLRKRLSSFRRKNELRKDEKTILSSPMTAKPNQSDSPTKVSPRRVSVDENDKSPVNRTHVPQNEDVETASSEETDEEHRDVSKSPPSPTGRQTRQEQQELLRIPRAAEASDKPSPPSPATRRRKRQEQQDLMRISKAAEALDKAGNDLFERGDYDKAMTIYTRALKLKRRTLALGAKDADKSYQDALLASVATSINNIGYLRQRSGATTEETMAAYRDSLQIKREILGNNDLSVGKTLNNIGSVYFSNKQFHEAIGAYSEAMKIMKVCLGEGHLDVATVHSNIGDVYLATRKIDKAREHYNEALKIRWTLGENNPKVVRLLEKIASIEMADINISMLQASLIKDAADEDSEGAAEQLHNLHDEVDKDITYVGRRQRELALDMVRDKLKMIREMRALENGAPTFDDEEDKDAVKSPSLTPIQRAEALSSVKDRLARLRESRDNNGSIRTGTNREGSGFLGGIDALRSLQLSSRNLGEMMEKAAPGKGNAKSDS